MMRAKTRLWSTVVVLFLAAIFIASAVANHLVDKRIKETTAEWSKRLDRPLDIGKLKLHFFPTAGISVEQMKVGPAKGEELALLTVEKVSVHIEVFAALLWRGHKLHVTSAEIAERTVNIVRLPDGSTNLSRLKEKLAQQEPATVETKEEPSTEKPTERSIEIDHAKMAGGKIQFVDLSGPARHQASISQLDLEAKDIRPGRPLDATLQAAILTAQKNFEVKVHSAPLAESLKPTLEQLTLKLQPVDLSPLAPFFPKQFPLTAGRMEADWTAQLGALAPGGKGKTQLSGAISARGLRFSGAEEGKPLDATLETQVQGDAEKGSIAFDKLRVQLGPAGLVGHGRVLDFSSEKPKVENLEITTENFDPALLAQYFPPLKAALKGQIAGPIGLVIRGSGSEDKPAVSVQMNLTPVRLALHEQMAKAAGAPMTLEATLRGQSGARSFGFQAAAHMAGVDLRPGGHINKAAGEKLELALQGIFTPASEKGSTSKLQIQNLRVDALTDSLTAKGSAEMTGGKKKQTTFALQLQSPHLDADRLLLPKPKTEKAAPKRPTPHKGGASSGPNAATAEDDSKRYEGLKGQITANLASVKYEGVQLTNVLADIRVINDQVTFNKFTAQAYGGQLSADGTKVKLGPADKPFEVSMRAQNIELGKALARGAPKQVLEGKFTGDAHFSGAGEDATELRQKLIGNLKGNLVDAALLGKDVVGALTGKLAKALPFASQALAVEEKTSLGRDVALGIVIDDGVAKLKAPLRIQRPDMALTVNGGVRLDGQLQFSGVAELPPALISKLTKGKASVAQAIPLAFQLVGPATSPELTGIDLGPAVQAIVKQAASGAANRFLGGALGKGNPGGTPPASAQDAQKQLEDKAKNKLRGLFGR